MSKLYWFLMLMAGCSPAMAGEKEDLESTVQIATAWNDGTRHIGSGVAIGVDEQTALIATCSHLFPVDDQARITVIKNGKQYGARVLARQDAEYDLALLAVDGDTKFRPAALCIDVPAAGQTLYYTGGAKGEAATRHKTTVVPWDASHRVVAVSGIVDHGQSGGGLFDEDGDLVGICSGYNPTADRRLARRSLFGTSRQLVVMLKPKD